MEPYRIVLWTMMGVQMLAWAWMQQRGGKLGDRAYLVFCGMMMVGQVGSGLECILGRAWGTLVVQAYFFVFTAWGGYNRWTISKNLTKEEGA